MIMLSFTDMKLLSNFDLIVFLFSSLDSGPSGATYY